LKKAVFTALFSFVITTMTCLPLSASAQDLNTCFIDSLNGKDRKELVKWIYFSMSAHPELESYTNIPTADMQNSYQRIGDLFTRLFVEDCPNEARAVRQADPQGLKKAFEVVVKIAIRDMLIEKGVRTAVNNYSSFVDQEKIKGVFVE